MIEIIDYYSGYIDALNFVVPVVRKTTDPLKYLHVNFLDDVCCFTAFTSTLVKRTRLNACCETETEFCIPFKQLSQFFDISKKLKNDNPSVVISPTLLQVGDISIKYQQPENIFKPKLEKCFSQPSEPTSQVFLDPTRFSEALKNFPPVNVQMTLTGPLNGIRFSSIDEKFISIVMPIKGEE